MFHNTKLCRSHSGHTVATQWPLVKRGDLVKAIKKDLSYIHFFLIPITESPRFTSGHCVAIVWPLCGHCVATVWPL